MTSRRPILRLLGLCKSFPGVRALDHATLDLYPGEIHALVGENGAGKSTLIKILTGAHAPDEGRLELDGSALHLGNPVEAQRAGIAAIYQEFNLIPTLTVRENLFLGRERTRMGLLDIQGERAESAELLGRLSIPVDPETPVSRLDLARQQLVEIARALRERARILIMDEPTAALTPREVESLFARLRELRAEGRAVLFVSHRLNEVMELADRVTVMRDGATLGSWPRGGLTLERMITLMVGRAVEQAIPRREHPLGELILSVKGLRGGPVRGVSFSLHRGEILGLAGLTGSGRTDLARLLFGADRPEEGEIRLEGREYRPRSPREAIARGVCLLTEDRKQQGLVLGLSSRENFALPNLPAFSRGGWIRHGREESAFSRYAEALRIRLSGPEQPAGHLSGGNQQKLLVARWLQRDSRVLLFDEPTRGIDVGAKYEMYNLIQELAARGKAILMISSELPEILGLSDRILVMHEGRVTGEIRDARGATSEEVLRLAVL